MSTFNAKRLTGLFLLILVSVGLITNLMKESEKQKLGRLVESRCAIDGLSKNGCKIKLQLAHLEATAEMLNSYQFANSSESAQRKMELESVRKELATIEKELEALNALGEESDESFTENDKRVLFTSHSAAFLLEKAFAAPVEIKSNNGGA